MKIREWIEWLQGQPAENELMLCDPDTQWHLPLQMTPGFPHHDPTPGETLVYAPYLDFGPDKKDDPT